MATGVPAEKRRLFASALRRHLKVWGLSQGALAERLGTAQSAVSGWVTAKSAPSPARVFELEGILGLAPGTLASLLQYRAPEEDEQHRCDVVRAVEDNQILSRAHKELLLMMYASLIELDAGRPPRSRGADWRSQVARTSMLKRPR